MAKKPSLWERFKTDAAILGDSVQRVILDGPMSTKRPLTREQLAQGESMAGRGGLSGRGRNSERQRYLDQAVGTAPKPKPKPRSR